MCQTLDDDICIKSMPRIGPRFPASQKVTLTSNYSNQEFDSLIIRGDALENLRKFKSNYFKCCVTSPPYWGLRDYGDPHQIGAELEMQDYIDNLVKVFREVKRTLTEDGTLWLNIGDSYTSGNRAWRDADRKNPARAMSYRPPTPRGLKPKDLIGIPWRLAFALQSDGWYLRSISSGISRTANRNPSKIGPRAAMSICFSSPNRRNTTMFMMSLLNLPSPRTAFATVAPFGP